MPRQSKTPQQRTADVFDAYDALRTALDRATDATRKHGHGSPEALKAWECVEIHGATIHRQSRILAGKSRGG